MLGFNGGLMGVRKVPAIGSASGLWFQNEQSVAKRAGIWPVGPNDDPYWSNVSLLLHMNGSNGSTTFTDNSSNSFTVTANSNAQISTAQSKFGGASGVFDGSGDYLSVADAVALELGGSDFTIELWFYLAADVPVGRGIIGKGPWPSGVSSFLIFYGGDSELAFYAASQGSGSWDIASNRQFQSNPVRETWHHVAVTRSGTTFRGFFNGTKQFEFTSSSSLADYADPLTIGSGSGGNDAIKANIDDVRITKGVARYTADFTPPTAQFPDS